MAYENNFFLGNGHDPLLQGENNIEELKSRLEYLQSKKKELLDGKDANQKTKEPSIWDKIDAEIHPLTDGQKKVLFEDREYRQNESAIMELVQAEMINLVRPRVESSPQGKQILESQYKLVKERKNAVIEEANKEIERFNAFKLASKANPELTYSEFINQIGE